MVDAGQSWDRVAAELRAARAAQQQSFGDIDNTTLGRYLAGELVGPERELVEVALADHPELRALTDLVSDVLREFDPAPLVPAEVLPPLPAPPPPDPLLRRLTPALRPATNPVRAWPTRAARYLPLTLAAGLLLTLGQALPQERRPADGLATAPADVVAMRGGDVGFAVAATRTGGQPGPAEPAPLPHLAGPYQPDRLVRLGLACQQQGDLTGAERALGQARDTCLEDFGPHHPATRWATRNLAGVYQTALAPARAPAQHPAGGLRDSLLNRSPEEIRARVVPVLTAALPEARSADERANLARALTELGPAAREALPALRSRLAAASDPAERRALADALELLDPNPDTGIRDRAGCFTPQAARRAQHALHTLAQQGVPVRVETYPSAPIVTKSVVFRTTRVIIGRDDRTLQVVVQPRAVGGLGLQDLQAALEPKVRAGDFDGTLALLAERLQRRLPATPRK